MKIRAWHKTNKEWLSFEELFKTDQYWQNPFQRDDLILVRSTELHDKNGKEIWEGDIVLMLGTTTNAVVVFKYGAFRLQAIIPNSWNPWVYEPGNQEHIEILGNIYSNPELFK